MQTNPKTDPWQALFRLSRESGYTMLNLEVFVLGYGVAMLAGARALHQRGLKGW